MCYSQKGVILLDKKLETNEPKSDIAPVLVTDDLGKNWRSLTLTEDLEREFVKDHPRILDDSDMTIYYQRLQEFVNARISTLIPVLVRMPAESRVPLDQKTYWRPDIILWYKSTDSLRSILSESNIAIGSIFEIDNNPVLQKTTPGAGPFETDNTIHEVINLYPNPATDQTTLTYHLDRQKMVSIAMHDISGKLIKVYAKGETRSAGKNKLTINVKDLVPGMYLISIQTEDGNIFTQRLIKQ
jgi:hypothetical protein